ncbi:MAG TPA: aldehyde dehydrogenase family protein [Pseudolysinimonas sp.]|nr:aldehyde dehydrogenase family protein [Pseudolysinimonas sp.]
MTLIYNPIDGSTLREVADAGPAEIDRVFEDARAALPGWMATPPTERGRIMMEVNRLMLARADEFARLESENIGTPLSGTLAMAKRASGTFSFFGGYADKITGDVIPVSDGFHTYTRREPFGVVTAIVPWNAPLIFATKKIAPAIAFGNVCILKPAAESPLTAMLLAEIMEEAGLPHGVAQVVTGGRETGELLVSDPRNDLIVFTGSDATGRAIAETAAANLTPVALELGGKSPQIVFEDADIDRALHGVTLGVFSDCGQACIAGSRLLVQESIREEFMQRLVEFTSGLTVGDPLDPSVKIGPQATRTQQQKTLAMIEQAKADGARVAVSIDTPDDERLKDGFFVPPTIFDDVAWDATIMQREVFGPVLAVAGFQDETEAIERANGTDFGLAAGIWTGDVGRAHRVAGAVQAGNVYLNTYFHVSDQVPFGGMKRSGYGREGGRSAVDLYTQVKTVWTSLTPGIPDYLQL